MMPGRGDRLVCRKLPSSVWGQWHRENHCVYFVEMEILPGVMYVDTYKPGLN